jgi:hypothetical protein
MNTHKILGIVLFLVLSSEGIDAQTPKSKSKHSWYYGYDGALGCLGLSKDNPGTGPVAAAYVGCMFTKNAGLELNVNCLIRSAAQLYGDYVGWGGAGIGYGGILHSSMLRFIPAMRLESGNGRIHLYSRTGLVIGIPVFARLISITAPSDTIISSMKGGLSWGFLQALGVRYECNARMSLSAEIWGLLESWAPHRSEIVKYSWNGMDQLQGMSKRDKETIYYDSYNTQLVKGYGIVVFPPDQPRPATKFYIPYSATGFSLGIHVKISKP